MGKAKELAAETPVVTAAELEASKAKVVECGESLKAAKTVRDPGESCHRLVLPYAV